ncbi:MAG TPA: ribonuclease Z [Methanothermococcus okinawensis]|uniref:Ribonuclease Z n=1 Tax=Methanofervidicoccus abyssi TaxID=2082189 RepID=A0A401HRF3_9EURY|nr:ribonuclease Z [Methanofervidicoccus abyssi]GBF36772.1 ribonuclease Z [Methanofervidicoccus abyssi]HIP16296.1 ribonuclease Z [Methanothermococcus okinawensis]
MKIVFLGTGSSIPTKKRNQPSIALKYNGDVLLFDCGEGTQRQIVHTDISPMKIKHIFISHLHGDHILGISGLLQSMGLNKRKIPIHIYGPPETEEVIRSVMKLGFHTTFDIYIHEISTDSPQCVLDGEKYQIYSYPMKHSVPTLGYIFKEKKKPQLDIKRAMELGVMMGPDLRRLKEGYPVISKDGKKVYPEDVLLPPKRGISIAYSGDTLPVKGFGEFIRSLDCRILIHEATFDSTKEDHAIETMHSTIEDAINIGCIGKVEKLILTHLSARYDDETENYLREFKTLREEKGIDAIVAEDLMEYPLISKGGGNIGVNVSCHLKASKVIL